MSKFKLSKLNPFKKDESDETIEEALAKIPGAPDTKDMNVLQRFAYKKIMAMPTEERNKLMQKMLTPENVQKNKQEILSQIEALKKSGKVSDDQIRLMKARLGLK